MDLQYLIELDQQLLLWFNGSQSLLLDLFVKSLTTASTWIPLYVALFYLVVKNNDSMLRVFIIVACAALCALVAGNLNDLFVKPEVARWRPGRDPQIGYLVDVVNGYRSGRFGFFSSHASNTFSIAVFFSLLVRSRLFTFFMVLWALVNCWTRLYLGVHFPGDILCGLLWGGIVGTGVYFLYVYACRRMNFSQVYVSSAYTRSGYLKSDVDVVISVLMFLFVYCLLRACFALYL